MIKAASYIISRANENTKIIPGHGKLSNKKELIKYRDTMVLLRDRMQKLIPVSYTHLEIIKLKPNADIDKVLGHGFLSPEHFLKILYGVVKQDMK